MTDTLETLRAKYEAAKTALIDAMQASVDEHLKISNGHMPCVAFNWLCWARSAATVEDFAGGTFKKRKDALNKAVVLAARAFVEARDGGAA